MRNKSKFLIKILISILILSISILVSSYNLEVKATSLTSGSTTISEDASSSASNSSFNDPTIFNANAGSNTYTVTNEDDNYYLNSTNSQADNSKNENTAETETNSATTGTNTATPNYYDQALVSSSNTISPESFDVGNIINILLIVIGVLIIIFAGAILIKLRLNQ